MLRPFASRAGRVSGALLSLSLIGAAAAVPTAGAAGPSSPTAVAHTAVPVAQASKSSLSVSAVRRNVIAGQRVVVRGTLRPAAFGRFVALQVLRHGRWVVVDHARTGRRGVYTLRWRASQPGSVALRVRFKGHRGLLATHRNAGRASVYRRAFVSWYGPGLYGNHLACGGTLSAGTLGVAHKYLPCGTMVTLRYRGRSVRVPVVDRGPYVAGREFDLTAATKQRLGFGSTGVVLATR